MRIALVMLDQNFGGMQKAFLNYSIELSNRGLKVLSIARKGAAVEKLLAEHGIASAAILNNRFGFQDILAIQELAKKLSSFFGDSNHCFILAFGARATLFAGKACIKNSKWKTVAMLPNSVNYKYYKHADILVPSTKTMASADYHKNFTSSPPPIF